MKQGLAALLFFATTAHAQLGADNKPMVLPPPKNPEFTQCGKRFNQRYVWDLNEKQRTYRDQRTIASYDNIDLDNEGTNDSIVVQSISGVEPCEIKNEWYEKNTSISIRYDADHYFTWEGVTPGLIKEFDILPKKHQITLKGNDYNGKPWQRTVPYELPEGR
jgi:hypothetical protein